jgi:hypothetical protein
MLATTVPNNTAPTMAETTGSFGVTEREAGPTHLLTQSVNAPPITPRRGAAGRAVMVFVLRAKT